MSYLAVTHFDITCKSKHHPEAVIAVSSFLSTVICIDRTHNKYFVNCFRTLGLFLLVSFHTFFALVEVG